MLTPRRPNGTATHAQLASLALSSGFIDKNEPARQAFLARLAAHPAATQKALFARVSANNAKVAAKVAAEAAAKPIYPASWLRASGVRRITEGRS